ncbi:hypothetical protein HAP93_03575 [Acidithiobacillus ferriphilus]|uniref:hypothetical protein n=1 Tax=Acidithiobacillus ferriphilus TaxID=1689834 RepID=UPI001C062C7E|nr:hypothetical protein [Acidithiobacillus ferriphilus]MBU2784855.1 hypothetical protein [Acidithiobacillus ferriphilus]UEP59774.1 hypothetical protein K1Y48_03735 [Acidithiobacillus ferriphilus]
MSTKTTPEEWVEMQKEIAQWVENATPGQKQKLEAAAGQVMGVVVGMVNITASYMYRHREAIAAVKPMLDAFFPRGAVPTAEDTATARKDAQGVLDWLRANLAKRRPSADIARELEDLLFSIGSIRMLWALMPDEDAAGRYMVEREDLNSQAPFEVRRAFAKAENREHEERAALIEATFNLSQAAEKLQSARLREAVNVMQSMAGFFRIEPDGPAKKATRTGAKKAAAARHAASNTLKERILAECVKLKKGTRWKNPAARKVAPDAFQWNSEAHDKETGRDPFTWRTIAAAERQVRRWLDDPALRA